MSPPHVIGYIGELPNLRLLQRELESDPIFARHGSTTFTPLESDYRRLGHAPLAELLITFASGAAINFVSARIEEALARARRRGEVQEKPAPPEDGENHGTPPADSR